MMLHPKKQITLYDVAEVVEHIFYKALTLSNNVKGFEVMHIYPGNMKMNLEEMNFILCNTLKFVQLNIAVVYTYIVINNHF